MIRMSDAQGTTVREVLTEWLDEKNEVITDAHNYGMNRREVIELYIRMVNVYLILTQTCGVDGKELNMITTEEFTEFLNSYEGQRHYSLLTV